MCVDDTIGFFAQQRKRNLHVWFATETVKPCQQLRWLQPGRQFGFLHADKRSKFLLCGAVRPTTKSAGQLCRATQRFWFGFRRRCLASRMNCR